MGSMKTPTLIDTIPEYARRRAKYEPVAAILREVYGYPDWRQAYPPVDELVDCILSQSTTDANKDRAFALLKGRFATWEEVRDSDQETIIETIRPAGLAHQKAPVIQGALRYITDQRGEINIDFLGEIPINEAKAWLTAIRGVGPKTAAIVLCFAFNLPAFPVDTHIHRLGQRIGFLPTGISADKAHDVMESIVPPSDYYAFHLNLIQHGREVCIARFPRCERCPITAYCDYYQQTTRA
jgi:endonuclease-3